MWIFLLLLRVLCTTPVHSIFAGTCLRKEPPPGVLVLSPGSKLVLTCSGHVTVDGVKVNMARRGNNSRGSSTATTPTTVNITKTGVWIKNAVRHNSNPTEAGVTAGAGENRSLAHTDMGYTSSPTTHTVQPSTVRRPLTRETNWEAKEMDGDYEDDEEEEGGEGSRVTRGIKSKPQWKWNRSTVGKGDRDWGEITFERRGGRLSLSSVRLTDSGKYTCYYRGRERFSLKVYVADPPESPSLSCYKKSPSSKIRCEWAPQRPLTILPNCSLFLSKSPKVGFLRLQCSYSSRLSRCWCALDHIEDERRTLHMAYLCVTSIAGSAISTPLNFIPLDILKPDPPSYVSVRQEEGQEMMMVVTWSFPTSWKSQDSYYKLMYEIKYKPLRSSHEQIMTLNNQRSYTITDAMPGVEYLIQLRTKDEYDGQWSDWSTPVNACSWTARLNNDLATTMFSVYTATEGSGTENVSDAPELGHNGVKVSHHVLWIAGSFALLSVILAVYIFRHKDRFLFKLQSLSVVTQCGDLPQPSPQPSAPAAPEVQALVTFAPPRYKGPSESEVEEEEEGEEENVEEQQVKERIEAMHFNNTSYFLIQR